ncbi:MAG: hypothetical protein NTW21_27830 [Verrucomicrobia bacterium]|nr:hypothetical protein [Verrucomicrobiota bacterium]
MKTNRTDSQPSRLWPRSLASITSTFTGARICAVLTLLLLAFSGPTAMAGVVDVTHLDNVLGGLAATPANVAVSPTDGASLSLLTDNQASDNNGDTNGFFFSWGGASFPELLAITGFNASLNKVRIYLGNLDGSRILGDISIKASATQQTSLTAGDYELNLGTFYQAGRTYTDYAGSGRAYFDMEVSAPAGTKSILLSISANGSGGNGGRIHEIQALGSTTPPPSNPYASWVGPFFGGSTNQEIVGQAADPDGDNQNNLMEFALDGTPNNGALNGKVYSYSGIPTQLEYPQTGTPQKVLILTIAVRDGTADFTSATEANVTDGIRYTVEGGTTLNSWTGGIYPFKAASYPELPSLAGTGYHYQSFVLTGTEGLPDKGFMRVKVEPAP